jgi:anti-sigma factor RsiW
MKCKQLHKKLIFFLEGDLPQKEKEQIKKHLAECPECAGFTDDLKKTLNILQSEKSPEVNPFFYTRLKAKMENQAVRDKTQPALRPALIKILQPALFTLLLLAGIYSGYKIGKPEKMYSEELSYNEEELFSYINEMQGEPIETFFLE